VTFQVVYISDGGSAFAFYSYEKDGMLFDSVHVLIGHMYGGEIYGEYDSTDGTRLLRPDQNLLLDSKCLGFGNMCVQMIEFASFIENANGWFEYLK